MSFTQEENPACPECQSGQTVRQVSMPSIHFRGSGFYKTDARTNEDEKEKTADPDSATDTQDNGGEKSDASNKTEKTEKTKSAKQDKTATKASNRNGESTSD